MKITLYKMVYVKNMMRVLEYVKKEKIATPTEIATELNIGYNSVNSAIKFLKQLKMIEIITNGRTTLVRRK